MTAGQPKRRFIAAQVVRELDHPQAKRPGAENPGRRDDERGGCCCYSTQLLNLKRIGSHRKGAEQHLNQIAYLVAVTVPNGT